MAMTDPIADMLTRIRNAGKAKLKSVDVPGSKLKIEIAKVMQEQGYIKNYKIIEDDKQGILRLYLKYDEKQTHAVYGLERVSKPSRRMYSKSQDIKPVLNGLGIAILSTSKGIMTDKQARTQNVGGEVLCKIW
ncbi:30S ribosomal protein S8 [Desulforegula conservatrix]|uniref:30S ribosomal protein S8 n=1 Tax=Desulforegula conservatrix TaxID=153026 RepID=UPI000486F2BB|nr:30S ribosomal protein S8 [Desulforegula conservatrix]